MNNLTELLNYLMKEKINYRIDYKSNNDFKIDDIESRIIDLKIIKNRIMIIELSLIIDDYFNIIDSRDYGIIYYDINNLFESSNLKLFEKLNNFSSLSELIYYKNIE